jgi:spore maturation protein CgeB
MLLTFTPDIVIPNGFTDGVDCATFTSFDEFESKLNFYLARTETVSMIAERGFQRLLEHHTTERRAANFLENALSAIDRPGHVSRDGSR